MLMFKQVVSASMCFALSCYFCLIAGGVGPAVTGGTHDLGVLHSAAVFSSLTFAFDFVSGLDQTTGIVLPAMTGAVQSSICFALAL